MNNKYKICVYAICKNEEKFIDRWYNSVKEADKIFVLDTGSEDNSVELLKSRGVIVKSENINPWRFDTARNKSLDMVDDDADICVCIDLDEVFIPGWRKIIEDNWKEDTTRIRYTYNWLLDEENNPKVTFYYEKTHARHGYKWTHPVHEVLSYDGDKESIITIESLVVNHYPDSNKSRSSYLPLLEISVKECPDDDRNMHYLGREYMYYGRYQESIDTLQKHLNLKSATWKDERCASMRFIGRCYMNMNKYDEAKIWFDKAIIEAPYLRDPYVEKAFLEYRKNSWFDMIILLNKALTIKNHQKSYINEIFSWDYTIDNLLSVGYYNLGLYDISLFYIDRALKYDNSVELLINNREIIYKKYKEELLDN